MSSAPVQLLFDLGLNDLNPIEVGEHDNYPDNFVRPKSFNGVIIHHIRSGWGEFSLRGKHYRVGPGQGFIILPGQEDAVCYKSDHDDPWNYMWISFTGKLAPRFSVLPPVFDVPEGSFPHTYDLKNATESIVFLLAADLHTLYAQLVDPIYRKQDHIRLIVDHIEENYAKKLTVEEFAARYRTDRRYLSQQFKAKMGVSIRTYLSRVRMRRSEELLLQGRSVREIALMCGFSSPSNFHKMFTTHHGLTPQQWKSIHTEQ